MTYSVFMLSLNSLWNVMTGSCCFRFLWPGSRTLSFFSSTSVLSITQPRLKLSVATTHERRARGWADQKQHFSMSAALPHRESNTTEILCCAYYNLPLRRFKQIVLLHFQVRVRCCRVQEVVLEIGCWLNAESQIPSTLLERGQPSD